VTSPFENLSGPGKPLKAEPPDGKEFTGLKRSGHARLKDGLNTSLSLESRREGLSTHARRNSGIRNFGRTRPEMWFPRP
jgi:hypothetical protein